MNLATAAVHVATVHFLGLCLFTPPPSRTATTPFTEKIAREFVVVLPWVPSHVGRGNNLPASSKDTQRLAMANPSASTSTAHSSITIQDAGHPHVQPHVALLILKQSDVVNVNGWTATPLQAGYEMIQLNGEHLTFDSDGQNDNVSRTLALGHVRGQLRPEYKSPGYSDAAAVFTISKGELAACSKDPLLPDGSVPLMSRIDTELKLKNSGQFTIRAGTKSLTVKGDGTVVVANVPMSYATGNYSSTSDVPHFTVYCAMMTGGGECEAPSLPRLEASSRSITQCHDSLMVMQGQRTVVPAVPTRIDKLLDSACSDSQWP